MVFGLFLIIMFIPWTQNIRARGNVTTLMPDQRPQTIHSVIAGRIEKWFVREGDTVRRGDTILFISEIKDDYFDPQLLDRTQEQLVSKEQSVESYMEKIKALDRQIDALIQSRRLKIEQTRNKLQQARLKVASDSIDYRATLTNFEIADEQFRRFEVLYNQGLKSLTELENRRLKLQEAQAKMISAENKLLTTRNELINARIELMTVDNDYLDKISKAESEKQTAFSSMYDAEVDVTKLQNQFTNYSVRLGLYYITAPQDGIITKTLQSGLGETLKEGDAIVSIMPSNFELAVEMYIKPIDLPLMEVGQHVRIQFDGWPAVIFSGWPQASYGTYGGEVFAIDNFISENGMYRVLLKQTPEIDGMDSVWWPKSLRVGAGVNAMALLKDVPIGYELWRQINGFPPDYYKTSETNTETK